MNRFERGLVIAGHFVPGAAIGAGIGYEISGSKGAIYGAIIGAGVNIIAAGLKKMSKEYPLDLGGISNHHSRTMLDDFNDW